MPNTLVTSGDEAISTTDHEWTDVLIVAEGVEIEWITLHNEGEAPGFWRLIEDNVPSKSARLSAYSVTTIPVPDGLSGGKLQVKRDIADGHLSGIFAWGTSTRPTEDEDDENDADDEEDEL